MNPEVYGQRIQNIIDAISLKEPEKIPVGLTVTTWPLYYNGTDMVKSRGNTSLILESYKKYYEDIKPEWSWVPAGINMPVDALQRFGIERYTWAPDGIGLSHNQVNDRYMPVEDYDEFIKNPNKYLTEKTLPNYLPNDDVPEEKAYENLKAAASEYRELFLTNQQIYGMAFEYNTVVMAMQQDIMWFDNPYNVIFTHARGIKDALVDFRRYQSKVLEACEAIWNQGALKKQAESGKIGMLNMYVYLSECFLSRKQFELTFVNYLEKAMGKAFDNGAKMLINCEGSCTSKADFVKDFPKGSIAQIIDSDDIFEFNEKVDGWGAVCGGVEINRAKFGTKKECIDYVHECVDRLAPGGGFLFHQQNSLLANANDAQIDNLLAALQEIHTYGRR